jgi:hypothetical protein
MKGKDSVVGWEISPRARKWGLRIGIPLAVLLGGSAVAWAAGLHTWSTGDTLQAADLNANFAYLQSEITALQAQVHAPSGFHAYLTQPMTIGSNIIAPVPFDTVEFDLANEYDNTTGTFKVTSRGAYLVHCFVEYSPAPGGTVPTGWAAGLTKNGTQLTALDTTSPADGNLGVVSEGVYQLEAGDAIQCFAYQNGSGNQALRVIPPYIRNDFSAARLY